MNTLVAVAISPVGTTAAEAQVPASFKVKFLDTLYMLSGAEVAQNFRVVGTIDSMLTYNFGMELNT